MGRLTRRGAGLRVRLLLTLIGAAMLMGGALVVALLGEASEVLDAHARAAFGLRAIFTVAAGMAALVVLLAWLLDRQLVSPLTRVDAALDRVSGAGGTEPLLPEGADLIGRVAPAINRLEQRLGEERQRVRAQIAALEKANEDLRTAREHAARAERLASVGRLAAGVAHEVGNPMTAVIGFLALLRDRLAKGKDALDYVDRIEREAARIDRILRDLLALARPSDRLARVDVQRCATQAAALVRAQPTWPAGTEVQVAVPQGLPGAAADEHYVVQMLVNLLVNAAKAGARTIRVTARQEEASLVVEVVDDGRGLPAGYAESLFEPFFTTAAPGEGTGLGLALCHATMERFGGSIEARPAPSGKGAAFDLRFRVWTEQAAARA
ncbi:MAG: sensor histidine kinase [Myxococcales bacterium]